MVETQAAGDAAQFAHDAIAAGAEMIVVAGGDGTIHEVVEGMSADFGAAVLCVVPMGTGNDFARSLGLAGPIGDVLSLLDRSKPAAIDLIRVRGRETHYVVNAATGGFSIAVEEKLTDAAKAMLGPFAYLAAAARSVADVKQYRARITIDDAQTVEADTPNIVIANGRFVAGGHHVAPQADLRDGRLDLIVVTAQTLGERLKLLAEYGAGRHLESDDLLFHQARKVRIESDPPMPFSLDGETVPGEPDLTFEVLPGVLRVLMPHEPRA